MKERGMLFGAPMVLALLDGSKTQTRRLVKPQPMESDGQTYGGKIFGPEMYEPAAYDKHGEMVPGPEIFGIYTEDGDWGVKCPYGKPGDRLWVREAWSAHVSEDHLPPRECSRDIRFYEAEHGMQRGLNPRIGKLRPSIFMPHWHSRITLEVTGVRVERLQDIHSADALAEGIYNLSDEWHVDYGIPGVVRAQHPVRAYQLLWESINGAGSWDANPWVWVIEFKRVEPGKQEFDIPNFLRKRHDDE